MPGELGTPTDPLFRIGRFPKPLDLPPVDRVGAGRYDDPRSEREYRVLYAGDRLACCYESLAQFRVALGGIATEGVTSGWLASRRIASFSPADPGQRLRWLDLGSPTTYAHFRSEYAALLKRLGYGDFDLSVATSKDPRITQRVGLWAKDNNYHGLRYPCRHDPALNCWAIFDGTPLVVYEEAAPLTAEDPDLRTVAAAWSLPLPQLGL